MSSIASPERVLKRSPTYQVLTPPHGPWPWYDIPDVRREETPPKTSNKEPKLEQTWQHYPQAFFPHWTDQQLEKTGLKKDIVTSAQDVPERALTLRSVDITGTSKCKVSTQNSFRCIPKPKRNEDLDRFWATNAEEERKEDLRVRILVVEHLSWEGLQLIGTKYHMGPFFFLTALHSSPSQYHKKLTNGESLSIVLPFLRTKKCFETDQTCAKSHVHFQGNQTTSFDLLAIHMNITPDPKNNTIICFHPAYDWRSTYEDNMHQRIEECCEGGPYREILDKQSHPVFVLLLCFWHIVYAWDQALDLLYPHINKLEGDILRDAVGDEIRGRSTRDLRKNAQTLHFIRAELLSYHPYLMELRRSVEFARKTFGSTGSDSDLNSETTIMMQIILDAECEKLIVEIERLDESRKTPAERLGNVIDLVFNQGSIIMTEAALTDSAAMMQLSFLAMLFLPASFVASVFGISMSQIDPQTALIRYLEVAIPLTTITLCLYFWSRNVYYDLDSQQHSILGTSRSWMKNRLDRFKRNSHRGQAENGGSGQSVDTSDRPELKVVTV